jgi:hypothetical protein
VSKKVRRGQGNILNGWMALSLMKKSSVHRVSTVHGAFTSSWCVPWGRKNSERKLSSPVLCRPHFPFDPYFRPYRTTHVGNLVGREFISSKTTFLNLFSVIVCWGVPGAGRAGI